MIDVAAILNQAAATIRDGFCQGAMARDQEGRPAHPVSPSARSWSVPGAVYRAVGYDGSPERLRLYGEALAKISRCVPGANVHAWNDGAGVVPDQIIAALTACARAG